MEVEFPQMILPFMIATVLLFSSLLAYATAMHLIVRVMVRVIRSGSSELGFWKSTAVMAIVTAIMAAAHLAQIALWAVAFLAVRAGLDLGDGLLLVRPKLHGSRLWRRPAVRAVAVTRPPRGHQRPPVLWTVNGRVVRDHEPVDRQAPTDRNRVPERGSREPGASFGGRRRVIEVSLRILVKRTLVRRGGRVMSSVTLTPAAMSRPAVNPWLVAVAVVVPTFMEILDTTIATASLRYIAGGLSATMDDSDWVMTSYPAANATILPITGWISAHLGRRNDFLLSTAVLTIASVLGGVATSLEQLILFRVIQGLEGGKTDIANCNGRLGKLGQVRPEPMANNMRRSNRIQRSFVDGRGSGARAGYGMGGRSAAESAPTEDVGRSQSSKSANRGADRDGCAHAIAPRSDRSTIH